MAVYRADLRRVVMRYGLKPGPPAALRASGC